MFYNIPTDVISIINLYVPVIFKNVLPNLFAGKEITFDMIVNKDMDSWEGLKQSAEEDWIEGVQYYNKVKPKLEEQHIRINKYYNCTAGAAKYGQNTMLIYLKDNSMLPDELYNSCFSYAASGGYISTMELIYKWFQYAMEPHKDKEWRDMPYSVRNFSENQALNEGIRGGHIPVVEYIKSLNLDIKRNEFNESFYIAAECGNIEIMQILLDWIPIQPSLPNNELLLPNLELQIAKDELPKVTHDTYKHLINLNTALCHTTNGGQTKAMCYLRKLGANNYENAFKLFNIYFPEQKLHVEYGVAI